MGGFQLRIFMRNFFTDVLECRDLSYFRSTLDTTLSQYMHVSLCYPICNYLESTWPFDAPLVFFKLIFLPSAGSGVRRLLLNSWLNKFRKYGGLTFPSDHGGVVLVENKNRACMSLDQPTSSPSIPRIRQPVSR
jgi:hypothetical protein